MWVIATLGAASGFIESTLAQIYKVKKPGGGFMGGPAYYIKNALGSPFWAGVFAVLISVTYALIFNSVQANTISLSIETTTGLKPAYTGMILAVLTGLVIFGGMTRIAKVASFMVPFMAGAYLLLAFVVTCMNITEIPRVLLMIVTKAFSFDSITGAAIGVALMTGIKRGLFSNEAGMGAVPNAARLSPGKTRSDPGNGRLLRHTVCLHCLRNAGSSFSGMDDGFQADRYCTGSEIRCRPAR